ncbi:ABC transporter substrate-binding protein [bacterium]|nr:ABC transporter substrate-binding protein [bacterium]
MMSIRLHTHTVLLTLLFVSAVVPSAIVPAAMARQATESQAIRDMLEERETEIKAVLGQDDELSEAQMDALREAVNNMFDFGAMGRAALGRHWDELPAVRQREFVAVFSEIVRYQSLGDVDIYRAAVTYEDITVSGNEAHVMTTTFYKDVPTTVEYKLQRADNTWLATDVILDEISTVEGYSRSFQSYIRKRGFDALMDNLNKRLEQNRSRS